GVISNWPPTKWAAHASLGYLPRSCQYRRYVLVPGKHAGTSGRNRRRRRELHAERKAMSSLAPHMEAFLREHLVRHRGASQHTCDSYAYSFQSLFEFAAKKLKVAPSALMLEQLDAALISTFLEHLETTRGNSAETRTSAWLPSDRSSGFSSTVSQAQSNKFAVFWRYLSRKPTLVWCLIWSRKKYRPCSMLLIHPRGRESAIGPCCIWRCAPGSESRN